jgi:hypothetical protein
MPHEIWEHLPIEDDDVVRATLREHHTWCVHGASLADKSPEELTAGDLAHRSLFLAKHQSGELIRELIESLGRALGLDVTSGAGAVEPAAKCDNTGLVTEVKEALAFVKSITGEAIAIGDVLVATALRRDLLTLVAQHRLSL